MSASESKVHDKVYPPWRCRHPKYPSDTRVSRIPLLFNWARKSAASQPVIAGKLASLHPRVGNLINLMEYFEMKKILKSASALALSWIPQFYPQITQINADFHRVAHE
jgi:hypothetical protein